MSALALVDAVRQLDDDLERALAAGAVLADLQAAVEQAKACRHEAVVALRARGYSHADVAAALGVSRGRAQQLAEGRTSGRRTPD